MDKLSHEIITLIIERACEDDFGKTARQLGLVSKYFRTIAEPIEFRTIAVSGPDQLLGIAERLDIIRFPGPEIPQPQPSATFRVKHLFICELSREHAVNADTSLFRLVDSEKGTSPWRNYWRTKEGAAACESYFVTSWVFWVWAAILVKATSNSLKSLFLLTNQAFSILNIPGFQTVFCALDGIKFPHLEYLVVNDSDEAQIAMWMKRNLSFRQPIMPSLRRLHFVSPIDIIHDELVHYGMQPFVKDVHHAFPALVHFTLTSHLTIKGAEDVMKHLLGADWETSKRNRTLPGNLRVVEIQQGATPRCLPDRRHRRNYHRAVEWFKRDINKFHIEGLLEGRQSHIQEGQTLYEWHLADWEKQCLLHP